MADKKHKLTEELKVIELQVEQERIELANLSRKLDASYKYEDELLVRLASAREATKETRVRFFQTANSISEKYESMKKIVDVFMGEFLYNIQP
jgi:hypothetical protein